MFGLAYRASVRVRVRTTMLYYYSGILLLLWLLVTVMVACWRLLIRPKGRRAAEMIGRKTPATKLRDSGYLVGISLYLYPGNALTLTIP